MSDDLRQRLRRLGVTRGARDLKPAARAVPHGAAHAGGPAAVAGLARQISGGRLEETSLGECYVVDHVYPLHYEHGRAQLATLLTCNPAAPAKYLGETSLNSLAYEDFLFLDTETTGLAGASTLAFMVGVAFFEQGADGLVLVVRQFFLRDHGDEPAMLLLLDDLSRQKQGLVTFNGRNFDVPLLRTRYLLNRATNPLDALPHLDLLTPARRLWRRRFGSVALGNLERELLGVRRTQDDIPGWLIPSVYHNYLRTGDARDLSRVFYHNQIDMLSMVTLATEVTRVLDAPEQAHDPQDAYSVGKWQLDLGLAAEAEQSLRQLLAGDAPLPVYHDTLCQLALLLKRANRHDEAVPLWQQWAATSMDDVSAHVELAKYFEWQARDLAQAMAWTRAALDLTARWPSGHAAVVRPDLEHRLRRLERKRSG